MRSARKPLALAALAIAAAAIVVFTGGQAGAEPGAAAQRAGSGVGGVVLTDLGDFEQPVFAAAAPGRANRKLLFVVEQPGTVRVIRRGSVLSRPFFDISDRISCCGERGLLSLEFDPDYADNRRFYVYYTGTNGDIRVSQMRRKRNNKVLAKQGSIRKVIQIPHRENGNHNGGQIEFAPDGNMWITTGDGGSACDPPENAQDPDSLLGKVLRITPRPGGGYRTPDGNPYADGPGADEIYALGLRNPFRFSIDERTGTIAIGDVGQGQREEIDYETLEGAKGANFGWDAFEGSERLDRPRSSPCGDDGDTPPPPDTEPPIFEYLHSGSGFTGCAITGGTVVRDPRLPTLDGRLLYSDFCNGEIRSIVPDLAGGRLDRALGPEIAGPSSFVEGRQKRVYVTSLAGDVYRFDPAGD